MINLSHNYKTLDGIKKLKKISFSTILILEEADKRGIDWEKLPYTDLFRLSYMGQIKYFHAQVPSETTEFARYCCKNKQLTRNILGKAGLSVTKGYLLKPTDNKKYLVRIFQNLKKPLVIKPSGGYQGQNVFLTIQSESQFLAAVKKIATDFDRKNEHILVEEMFEGDEYRVLATQNKILSVIKRLPPNVMGDGKSSIQELIDPKNLQPLRDFVATYSKISIDSVVMTHLQQQSLSLESILAKDQRVTLRPPTPCNINFGGDTIDVTEQIHPSVVTIIQSIMDSIPGLSLAGIDFMTKDITKHQQKTDYSIIEVNSSPSLDWNQFPLEGKNRNVAFEFLKIMFPNLT